MVPAHDLRPIRDVPVVVPINRLDILVRIAVLKKKRVDKKERSSEDY
jgi:hypothetical protein